MGGRMLCVMATGPLSLRAKQDYPGAFGHQLADIYLIVYCRLQGFNLLCSQACDFRDQS